MNETRTLASFCAGLTADDLDGGAETAVTKALVDTLAASYAGVDTDPGAAILSYVGATDGTGDATVLGSEARVHPLFAALANGTTAHALDVDDGHRGGSVHPGSPTVPAALAVADREGATGAELVAAIAAGYEATVATATCVQPSHRGRGFHATATCGCFGAAAAAASLLDLDAESTAHALGLAGTQAGGLFEFLATGSMSKRFHPGRAAMAGILAADLAAGGFDGPGTIVEGEDGFAPAFADEYDLGVFERLGEPFAVTESYLKPYLCCRHVHPPIDAAIELRDGFDPEDVESIRVETFETASLHDKTEVETLLDAQMSIPYGVAVALQTGEARLREYVPPRTDGLTRDLMASTDVVRTDEMDERYPEGRPATLAVTTRDGGTHEAFVEYPLGAPENPMSERQLRGKFHDLAGSLPPEERESILDAAFGIADANDVSGFVAAL